MGMEDGYAQLFASLNTNPLKDSNEILAGRLKNEQERLLLEKQRSLQQVGNSFATELQDYGRVSPEFYQWQLAQNPRSVEEIQKLYQGIDQAGQGNLASQAIKVRGLISNNQLGVAADLLHDLSAADTDRYGSAVLARMESMVRSGNTNDVVKTLDESLRYNPHPLAVQFTANNAARTLAGNVAGKTTAETAKLTAEAINLGNPGPLISAFGAIKRGDVDSAVKILTSIPNLPPRILKALNREGGIDRNELGSILSESLVGTEGGIKALAAYESNRVAGIATDRETLITNAITSNDLTSALIKAPDDPRIKSAEQAALASARTKVGGTVPRIAEMIVSGNPNEIARALPLGTGVSTQDRELIGTITNGSTYEERFNALRDFSSRIGATPKTNLATLSQKELQVKADQRTAILGVVKGIPETVRFLQGNPSGYTTSEAYNRAYKAKATLAGETDVAQRTNALLGGINFSASTKIAQLLKPLTDSDIEWAKKAVNFENKSKTFYLNALHTLTGQSIIDHSLLTLEDTWHTANSNMGPNTQLPSVVVLGREYKVPFGYTYQQFVDKVLMVDGGEFQSAVATKLDSVFGNTHSRDLLNSQPKPPTGEEPNDYKDPYFQRVAGWAEKRVGLPPGLLHSIVTAGEKTNNDRVSSSGARTVFQIIPSTREGILAQHGVDAYSGRPGDSALAAAYLVKENLDRTNGNEAEAVRQYLLGPKPNNAHPIVQQMSNIAPSYINRVMVDYKKKQATSPTVGDTIGDMFTGNLRRTEETDMAEDIYAMPELNQFDLRTLQALATTIRTGPDETASIIKNIFPTISSTKDGNGNVLLHRKGDNAVYAIKPGMQFSDVLKTIVSGGIFAGLAAGAVAVAPSSPLIATAAAFGGFSAAEQGAQAASGGTFDPGSVALDTALGLIPVPKKPSKASGTPSIKDVVDQPTPAGVAELVAGNPAERQAAGDILKAQTELGIDSQYVPSLIGDTSVRDLGRHLSENAPSVLNTQQANYLKELHEKGALIIQDLTHGQSREGIAKSTIDRYAQVMRSAADEQSVVVARLLSNHTSDVLNKKELAAYIAERVAEGTPLTRQEEMIKKVLVDTTSPTISQARALMQTINKTSTKSELANLRKMSQAVDNAVLDSFDTSVPEVQNLINYYKGMRSVQQTMIDSSEKAFGEMLSGEVHQAISSGIKSAYSNDSVVELNKILDSVSHSASFQSTFGIKSNADLRQRIVGSALDEVINPVIAGGNFNPASFVERYALIGKQGSNIRELMTRELPEKTMQQLDNLYLLSKQLVGDIKPGTAEWLATEKSREASTAFTRAIRLITGGTIIDNFLTAFGVPFTGLGVLTGFYRQLRANPNSQTTSALSTIFTDPTILTALKASINGTTITPSTLRTIGNRSNIRTALGILKASTPSMTRHIVDVPNSLENPP